MISCLSASRKASIDAHIAEIVKGPGAGRPSSERNCRHNWLFFLFLHGVELDLPFNLRLIASLLMLLLGLPLLLPLVLVRVVGGRDLQGFLDDEVVVLVVVLLLLVEGGQFLEDGVEHLDVHDDLGEADGFDPLLEPGLEVGQDAVEEFVVGGVAVDVVQRFFGVVGAEQEVNLHVSGLMEGVLRLVDVGVRLEGGCELGDGLALKPAFGLLQHVLQEQQLELVEQQLLG